MNEVLLKTEDNIEIKVNHYINNKDEVVIICPGWFMTKDSKSITNIADTFKSFCDVISMDFRGHGKSSGFYTFTANEEKDLDIVVEFAKKNYKKVSLMGFSLGGALVVLHSSKDFGIKKNIVVSAPVDFYKIENHMYSPHAWYPTLFQKFEPKRWVTIRAGNPFLPKKDQSMLLKMLNLQHYFWQVKMILLFSLGIQNFYIKRLYVKNLISYLKMQIMQKICLTITR